MSTELLETCKGIARQVGYLLELYWVARSPEYKKGYKDMQRINLAQDRCKFHAVVITVMKLRVP